MSLRFTILGSGSGGNCAYLETPDTRLLIDAGFSARQIRQRLALIGRSPETLTGILITHEHSDHVAGLQALAEKLRTPVYTNRLTREAIQDSGASLEFKTFETGARFGVGDVEVESFSVPHDASDPVGFVIRTGFGTVGFLTDLGHATRLVVERVKDANILVLESNHDEQLLRDDTKRPWSLKQRILSRHGHLSNTAAGEVALQVIHSGLTHLFLGHLSRDCNRPELARACVEARLKETGATHTTLTVASQSELCATVQLTSAPPRTEISRPDSGARDERELEFEFSRCSAPE